MQNISEIAEGDTVNVTASFEFGKLTLTFPDYILGCVAPGQGKVELQDEVGNVVATLTNGAYGMGFNQIDYTMSTDLPAGTYKVVIEEGAVLGDKENAFGAGTPIPAATCFVDIVAQQEISDYFGLPSFEIIKGDACFAVKLVYYGSMENSITSFKQTNTGIVATLYEDGVVVSTTTFEYDNDFWIFGAKFNHTLVDGKLYKVVFGEGCYEVVEMDGAGVVTNVLQKSGEAEYEWVEGASSGGDPVALEPWEFESVSPAEGTVDQLREISLYYGSVVGGVNEPANLELVGDNGKSYKISFSDNWVNAAFGVVEGDDPITEEGVYTLTIPANTFTAFSNTTWGNAELTYSWVIGAGQLPNKRQETIFEQNNAVSKPVVLETDGVKMTTIGREFLGTFIDVAYNTYGEGKINWLNGTKLVFKAKDNITGIVIDGQFIEFAEADKGQYSNGVWTGKVEAGDSLVLTANDGININSIVILYNGAKYTAPVKEEKEVNIALNITKNEWKTIGSQNGEVVCSVSCDAEVFDHYYSFIKCVEDPDIFISFADLKDVSGNLTCYAWEGGSYDLYEGYHYTLTVQAFDSPFYSALPVATAVYEFVGTGKAPAVYNDVLVVDSLSLAYDSKFDGFQVDGNSFDVTFNAPVSQINAWAALGFDGSQALTAQKKNEEGTVWTITMPSSLTSQEGAINIEMQLWDANGVMARGTTGDHGFAFNIILSNSDPDAIATVSADEKNGAVYSLNGVKVNAVNKGGMYIINGKKVVVK